MAARARSPDPRRDSRDLGRCHRYWPRASANSFRAVHDGLIHRQPLRQGVLAGDHDVQIVAAAQAVVGRRQQAVGIGRQVDAHDVGLLVDHVVDEARVLVREAVVVLLPDVRGEQVVQRRDGPAPRQLARHLQPLGVLTEHRIDDADEGLVTVEEAVAPGQQVPFKQALALVLAEHRVEHLAFCTQELVVVQSFCIPLAVGHFEDGAEQVGDRFVGPEDAEVARILIEPGYIAQELAEHQCVLSLD